MEISFVGKRVLVTGAGKGIGRVISQQLDKCSAKVIALSRTQSDLESLKAECPNMEMLCCDLADWDTARALVSQNGPYDLLVNNAAVAICEPMGNVKPGTMDKHFDVNVKALLNMSQLCAESMISRGVKGSIVNISSQASMAGLADHVAYSASKGAVDAATRVMAVELGPKGIRVNSVNPTVITTDMSMAGWSDPARAKWMTDQIPLGRFGDPIEVAWPVLFLLSDKASMINGVCLPIDGGFLAQ